MISLSLSLNMLKDRIVRVDMIGSWLGSWLQSFTKELLPEFRSGKGFVQFVFVASALLIREVRTDEPRGKVPLHISNPPQGLKVTTITCIRD